MEFIYKCADADEQEWMFKTILNKRPMGYYWVYNLGFDNFHNVGRDYTKAEHFERWPYILYDEDCNYLAATCDGDYSTLMRTKLEFLNLFNINVNPTTIPTNGIKFNWPPRQ